jgi:hypothetical protein
LGNEDPLPHNVHSTSNTGDVFNTTIPRSGAAYSFQPKQEELMVRLGCDIHRWMTAYVGVVSNPFFAVTSPTGAFEISNVPSGTYTIRAWQEHYGTTEKTVKVVPGAVAVVDFSYQSDKKAPSARTP